MIILFYMLISVMPLARHPLWEHFVQGVTVIKYLGALCLGYSLVHLFMRRYFPPLLDTPQARYFLMLCVLAMVSFLILGHPVPFVVSPLMSYISFLVFFCVTLTLVDSISRLRWTMLVALGSIAFGSLHVLRDWQSYRGLNPNYRPGYIVGDPNYFTMSALLCLPFAFYLARDRNRPRWERGYCLGVLVVTFVAITMQASRGGFLGMIAAFFLMMMREKRNRLRNILLLSAIIIPLTLTLSNSPIHRLLYPNPADEGASKIRLVLWRAGIKMAVKHPIAGVGLGNFKSQVVGYEDGSYRIVELIAHNTYLEMAAELGLPGFVLFVMLLWSTYSNLEQVRLRALKTGPPVLLAAAQGIQIGWVSGAVTIFFVSGQYQKLFWLTCFLSMCLPALLPSAKAVKTQPTRDRRLPRVRPEEISPNPMLSY